METAAARVNLLGGFGLHLGESESHTTVDNLPMGVQRLIAYLGLSRRPARTTIAGQLWPDVSESQAHSSLRSALWRLQKAAPGVVDVSRGVLSLAPGVWVDVRELNVWAHRVLDPRADAGHAMPPGVGPGELLPGWYDDWVLLERERLRHLRMHALEAVADKLAAAGRYGEAVQAAYVAVRDEPLRETAHRVLVRIHLAQGNTAEAIRTFESFREYLLSEIGVEPSAQMEALMSDLRRTRPVRPLAPVRSGTPSDGPCHPSLHRAAGRAGGW